MSIRESATGLTSNITGNEMHLTLEGRRSNRSNREGEQACSSSSSSRVALQAAAIHRGPEVSAPTPFMPVAAPVMAEPSAAAVAAPSVAVAAPISRSNDGHFLLSLNPSNNRIILRDPVTGCPVTSGRRNNLAYNRANKGLSFDCYQNHLAYLGQVRARIEDEQTFVRAGIPLAEIHSTGSCILMPSVIAVPFYNSMGVRYYYDSDGDFRPGNNDEQYPTDHDDPVWRPFDDRKDYNNWRTANTKAIERREQAQGQV